MYTAAQILRIPVIDDIRNQITAICLHSYHNVSETKRYRGTHAFQNELCFCNRCCDLQHRMIHAQSVGSIDPRMQLNCQY